MPVLALAAALALTGCGGTPEPAGSPLPASTPDPSPTLILSGPADQPVRWPDGVSAVLAKVERVPNNWSWQVPATLALIRVTLEVTNNGRAPIAVVPDAREIRIFYGPNRTEAEFDAGYGRPAGARDALSNNPGTVLPAGGKMTFIEAGALPLAEMGDLAVQVMVPSGPETIREPFTFEDADTKLVATY